MEENKSKPTMKARSKMEMKADLDKALDTLRDIRNAAARGGNLFLKMYCEDVLKEFRQ
ncbi:MAG: hypothetical protein ABL951_04095 [Alphaproteobacteria bacterium]